MPGGQYKTNRLLLLISILLCLFFGATLTQSAPPAGDFSDTAQEAVIEADSTTDADFSDDQENPEEDIPFEDEKEEEPALTPTSAPKADTNASPEAAKGTWVPDGERWRFQVEDTSFTGWLHDVDGHIYYFDKNGYMVTGWLNHNGQRYYFDEDGIMQTGKVPVDGKVYLFNEDGTMAGYAEPTPTPTPEPTPTPVPSPTPFAAAPLSNGNKPSVAITFDDGPGDYTDRILTCLEQNKAKATFFMLGQQIESYPEAVKRMEALGCELGNHTYSHKELTKLTQEEISKQIGDTDKLLADLVGHGATVVRPPYGSVDDTVKASVGTPMILWSIDTLDWETKDPDQTIQSVVDGVTDGSIILMHDIYEETAQAAEVLIPKLIEAGYDLLTVHELAARHGVELKTGITYGEFHY